MSVEAAVAAPRKAVPFYAQLVANVISLAGSSMSFIAVPWFVLETTHSASKTGISAFFTTFPTVLAALFGSSLVDRMGYRKSSIVFDLASGFMMALIPLFFVLGILEYWHLLIFIFCAAMLDAPGGTARAALLPDVAKMGGVALPRAAALGDGSGRAARLLGAPLGGALIGWLGPTSVLWIDAATFVVSAAIMALLVPRPETQAAEKEHTKFTDHLLGGFRFLRSDHLILAITLTVMITNLLDAALGSVVMPIYAQRIFGSAAAQGFLSAAFGGGAVVGTLLFSIVGPKLPRRQPFILGFAIISLRFFALAAFLPYPVLVVIYVIGGLAVGPINPIASTLLYERIPEDMRARVFGVLTAGSLLGVPLAVLLTGYVVEALGLQTTLLLTGTLYMATAISMVINPALKGMNATAPQATPAAEGKLEEQAA